MIKLAISISCCLKLALLALFCITKPRKTLERDLTCYMVFQTKTYASLVSASPKSISDKRAAKKRKSFAKIVFLDIGTTVRHTFLSSELQCLPRSDPRNLCVNTRIRLLATHSSVCISQIGIIAAIICIGFGCQGFLAFPRF